MSLLGRTDRNIFANWWWTIDRWLLLGVVSLIFLGYVMAFAASPVIAQKLELPIYFFTYRQIIFLNLAFGIMLIFSFLLPDQLRRMAFFIGVLALIGIVATLFVGIETKGATRWLRIAGFSIQPSEFFKPCFVMMVAWFFSLYNTQFNVSGRYYALGILIITCVLLSLQPDIGQMVLLICVWGALFFFSGGSYILIAVASLLSFIGSVIVYHNFSHVQNRVDKFFNADSGDTYQTDKALDAIQSGGFLGIGLGDGQVKHILPDAHTDYVFAVAVEEGGMIFGILIMAVFIVTILRVFFRLQNIQQHWIQLSGGGLITLFGLQAVINLSVNLNIIPSKGMTLPFISYGGSSLLALALTMGILLSLTRNHKQNKRVVCYTEQYNMMNRGEKI